MWCWRNMLKLQFRKTEKTPLKILCLGAHSDDIEIGCLFFNDENPRSGVQCPGKICRSFLLPKNSFLKITIKLFLGVHCASSEAGGQKIKKWSHHRDTEITEIIIFFSFAGRRRQRKTNLPPGRFIIWMLWYFWPGDRRSYTGSQYIHTALRRDEFFCSIAISRLNEK